MCIQPPDAVPWFSLSISIRFVRQNEFKLHGRHSQGFGQEGCAACGKTRDVIGRIYKTFMGGIILGGQNREFFWDVGG